MKSGEFKARQQATTAIAAALVLFLASTGTASAQSSPGALPTPTYADLADLASGAALVVKAKVRTQTALGPDRSPFLRPGWVRLFIEANTEALLLGKAAIGESLRYLVDVPLDAKGRAPKLGKLEVILFALPVAGNPGDLQLVTNEAQVAAGPAIEAQVKTILGELAAPSAPPRVTGLRDAFSVAGNLAGESETQIFLQTDTDAPVSLSVIRRPGMAPEWGVAWTDIVDEAARPPARDTLPWYRLACFLPPSLPDEANLAPPGEGRTRAAQDYGLVIDQLGICSRNLHPPEL
jgi:hypothetical protein